ncbi:MAG: 5'/3'-nucleotidase SurE [Anaerolineae bacterium]|nr:5'/3'-nucleotidase SurE [Anaerolineae bacterium]
MLKRPLILLTNDDGIESDGLWAAVDALLPLGEVMVVAPDRQWSGAGRSMPHTVTGDVKEMYREVNGYVVPAYALDASPALCIVHAMIEFVARPPALAVAGINFGENISTEVTISGTVGAALEAAAHGIPALAISLEMPISDHLTGGQEKDYTVAQVFTRHFARWLLTHHRPYDVDALNVNVPAAATSRTPWQLTHLCRNRYFTPTPPNRAGGDGRPGYIVNGDPTLAEYGSDVWALHAARVVSVTPISQDITSRVAFGVIEEQLRRKE